MKFIVRPSSDLPQRWLVWFVCDDHACSCEGDFATRAEAVRMAQLKKFWNGRRKRNRSAAIYFAGRIIYN